MIEKLFWFSVTVLPLVIIPGPDMILCIAQGLSRGRAGVWRSVNGITLGYLAHALLAAAGLAALVAASPLLFEFIRWIGIAYIAWLSIGMLRSSIFPKVPHTLPVSSSSLPQHLDTDLHHDAGTLLKTAAPPLPPVSLWRGFLTSFLNPKGLFVYLSIVPQFIDPTGNTGVQALALSVTNAVLCYIVYTAVGLTAAHSNRIGSTSPLRMRVAEGVGGVLLGAALVIIIH